MLGNARNTTQQIVQVPRDVADNGALVMQFRILLTLKQSRCAIHEGDCD